MGVCIYIYVYIQGLPCVQIRTSSLKSRCRFDLCWSSGPSSLTCFLQWAFFISQEHSSVYGISTWWREKLKVQLQPRPVSQSWAPGHSSPILILAVICVEPRAAFLGHQPMCSMGNFFLPGTILCTWVPPRSCDKARPGTSCTPPSSLWISASMTQPYWHKSSVHFITNILVPLLVWAWTHQLALFPSPGDLTEENRALPFSSCSFPPAWWDTATHLEVILHSNFKYVLPPGALIKCWWSLAYCQESFGGTWSSWGQTFTFLLLCPVFSESTHSSNQMGFLKMSRL